MKETQEKSLNLNKEVVSVKEAARINGVTISAIRFAIEKKKLKVRKSSKSGRLKIAVDDLEEYRRNKYSRSFSRVNGELIFDNAKGFYSVVQVAKMLGVLGQDIYYKIRKGALKASRKGSTWVIHIDDIKEHQEEM
jgi:excisionase family DNA binding protein